MKKRLIAGITVATVLTATAVYAATSLVTMKQKTFSAMSLTVQKGDVVEFRNDDTVYHDIFSLSDNATFDLGSFGPSETRKITFKTPGKVEVECAVHKGMKMTIQVK